MKTVPLRDFSNNYIPCTFLFFQTKTQNSPSGTVQSVQKSMCMRRGSRTSSLLCASPLKRVRINANLCKRGLAGDGLMSTSPSLRCSEVAAAGGYSDLYEHVKSRSSPRISMRPAYFYDVIKSVRGKVILTRADLIPPSAINQTGLTPG